MQTGSIQTNKFQKRENSLGIWLSSQRRHFRNHTLSVARTQLLNDIGLVWEGNKVKLNLMYDRLMVFLEVNKKLPDSKESYIENQNFRKIFPDFERGNLKSGFKELLIKYNYEKWILRQRNRLTWDEIYDKVVEFRNKFKRLPTYKPPITKLAK